MLKLVKYLKPFTWQIILVFVLLFAQALTELALPGYMSDIINVGIQQNGISNTVPQAVRSSEMLKITLFMDDNTKAEVLSDFRLLDKAALSQDEYQEFLSIYPVLADEPVYVLNTSEKTEIDRLNSIFNPAIMIVYSIEKNALSSLTGEKLNIPSGTDPFAFLYGLPDSQLKVVRQVALEQITSLPESIITQADTNYLSAEYQSIGINVGHIQNSYILKVGGLMLLLALLGTACAVITALFSSRVAAMFARDLRRKLFNKVESFSHNEMNKFSTTSLITRTTNDIQQIQMVMIMLLRIAFYAPIMGIGGIILAMRENVSISWIIAVAVLAVFTMIGIVFSIAIPKFKLMQKLVDRLNLVTREILTGLMVIRAFNTQAYEEKKFDRANTDLTNTNLFVSRIMIFMMPAMMLIMNAAILLVIWFGSIQVDLGTMQVGSMMAFMQYTILIIFSFLMVSMTFIMLPRASVSGQRIAEVLNTKPSIIDPREPLPFQAEPHGTVEFENVSFKYPGAEDYVLKNISFTAKSGQTTAFIGGTGSGKTTLINLIPRFYDVTEGRILVNNLDIRNVSQNNLREKIGYIPQKTVLFSGTIESNIRYANENATDKEILKAAEIAQSLDFIQSSENTFQSPVAQGGVNLSGGQKQRLSIARALAKKPEIYIFDDSFSALDFKTDAALRRSIRKETSAATVLIVAQRISTIINSDQIIVLDKGEVVGRGTHKDLMANCTIYRELALSQLSMEELA